MDVFLFEVNINDGGFDKNGLFHSHSTYSAVLRCRCVAKIAVVVQGQMQRVMPSLVDIVKDEFKGCLMHTI